jgi:spermidine synthase
MSSFTRRVLFLLFFLSGFSSLIYQVVWTRIAFASFGIIAPVLSVVLSVFMLGLAVGSWAGGQSIAWLVKKTGLSAAAFYGCVELIIGLGAFAVPSMFLISARLLLPTGQMDSFNYLLCSALALGLSIFPWCLFMGATFPFMMAHVREQDAHNSGSFSYLYLANVLGAMCGAILTALVLVEMLGFHHTLWVAAASNFTIALISFALASAGRKPVAAQAEREHVRTALRTDRLPDGLIKLVLFTTGFTSLAMEVVWSRGFTPVLKTQIYSFALIVFTYLGATFAGSLLYRRDMALKKIRSHATLFTGLAMAAFFPVLMTDPSFRMPKYREYGIDFGGAILALESIVPLCALLGYLTPSLIDDYAGGDPRRAGKGYAINVLGCILGPLVACYFLMPQVSGRFALIILALPFVAFWLAVCWPLSAKGQIRNGLVIAGVALFTIFVSRDFEELVARAMPNAVVRRDYMASIISLGTKREEKHLWVNGVAMTTLTPITKFMAHLPLALHEGEPKSALVICFGMGTTFRSSLTWGIDTTVVELVPSVPKAFGYYFADADKYANDPNGHIIVDDGRRYLARCARKFDIIVVDPPPPTETAGSSLLFSEQYYTLAKEHLNPNGIAVMWYPDRHDQTCKAVIRSMHESFPYLRCFDSVEGWGMHLFGSMTPIPNRSAEEIIARMPEAAKKDLMEWTEVKDPVEYMNKVVGHEFNLSDILNPDESIVVTDDRPYNEYYVLRRLRKPVN